MFLKFAINRKCFNRSAWRPGQSQYLHCRSRTAAQGLAGSQFQDFDIAERYFGFISAVDLQPKQTVLSRINVIEKEPPIGN